MAQRNDFERNPMRLQDLLADRAREPPAPATSDELERKFFRWLDYEERAGVQ